MTKQPPRAGWVEHQRSPRYDIWVGNTQVADPAHYRLATMAIWDGALGESMTNLDGHPAGAALDRIAFALELLRNQPPSLDLDFAVRALKWMRHLSAGNPTATVAVRVRVDVSNLELVAGVLVGAITRAEAISVVRARGGTEADARLMLNHAHSVLRSQPTHQLFVVACSRAKLDHPAPAHQLYTGSHFRYVLAGVRHHAGDRPVRILSARHGLVDPDTVLEPYDTTMTDRDSITPARLTQQLAALPGTSLLTIHAYLPRRYLARMVDAITDLTRPCEVRDEYAEAGCRGIGDQRRVIANLGGAR